LGVISVHAELCSGCRLCELVCAAHHFGVNNPKKAAIRVFALFPEPVKNVPVVCTQCDDPECIDACPTSALTKKENGMVRLDPTLCNDCGECGESCPQGTIFFHREVPHPIICDLCGGEPRCVKICPTQALTLDQELRQQSG